MSLVNTPPVIKKDDWNSAVEFSKKTRQALQQLAHLRLGYDSHPTFEDLTLDSLTATRLVQSNASNKLVSVADLTSWVAGTANEIDIADDGDGTITIGIVNPLIVGKGGTGTDALTDHSLLVGSGADAVTLLGVASNGQLPIGSAGADPVLAVLTETAKQVLVANAAGSITLSTPQDIATDSTPTFAGLISTGVVRATDFAKTGWPTVQGVTLSFDNASKVFTVTDGGSAYYYIDGVKYTLGGNKTVDLDDVEGGAVEGLWYIYFVGATLTASQTLWSFRDEDKALVGYLYWDATNNKEIFLGWELHTFHMDGATHARLHYAGGARWETGLLVTDTGSDTINVSAGDIWDEDLNLSITDDDTPTALFEQILSPAQLPIYYRDGATAWRIYETDEKAAATDIGYLTGGNLQYNKLNGTWANATVSAPNHVAYWVVATNDQTAPIVLIMGQRIDLLIADAKENNIFGNLNLTGLPFEEMVVLARLILKDTGTYSLEEVLDLRAYNIKGNITSPLTSDHGGLAGLGDDDHPQYVKESDIKITTAFFTAATGDGVISNETYEANTVPANKVLTAFESDNDGITVTIEVHTVGNPWMPASVTVSGGGATPVQVNKEDWTQVADTRIWTASVALVDADTTGTLTATMSDGDTSTCEYTRAADPPDVSNAEWGEGDFNSTVYPTDGETGLQTAVKAGDTVSVQLDLSSEADTIRVCTGGASSADQDFSDGPYSGTVVLDDVVVVGAGTGAQVFTIKAKRTESDYGASDTTSNITLDQAAHDYTALHNTVFDPVENFALKDGDSCTGDVQITNWAAGDDVISYTSAEVTIANSTTYVETKTYTYLAGTYRDSGTNVTITSRRKANGKQDTHTYKIDICNAAPTLTMAGATTRLRSKTGADKTYSLTITSNYELQACTCERDAADDGPALGAWTGDASGDHTWTNTITIEENDTKNVEAEEHTWTTVLATTGSGLTTNSINTNPNYTVGGFESRDINFAAYETHNAIGTMVTNKDNAAKLTCEIVGVKELTYVGNDTPAADKFTITDAAGDFDADGIHVMCLDTDFINVGLPYILRVEELA